MNYLVEIKTSLDNDTVLSQWDKMTFVGRIPQKYIDKTDMTTVLITGLSNDFTSFGGNHSRAREQEIELKIWYKQNTSFEDFEWALNEVMESIGFYNFSYDGPEVDEETTQNKSVLQYRRTKFKGE